MFVFFLSVVVTDHFGNERVLRDLYSSALLIAPVFDIVNWQLKLAGMSFGH